MQQLQKLKNQPFWFISLIALLIIFIIRFVQNLADKKAQQQRLTDVMNDANDMANSPAVSTNVQTAVNNLNQGATLSKSDVVNIAMALRNEMLLSLPFGVWLYDPSCNEAECIKQIKRCKTKQDAVAVSMMYREVTNDRWLINGINHHFNQSEKNQTSTQLQWII